MYSLLFTFIQFAIIPLKSGMTTFTIRISFFTLPFYILLFLPLHTGCIASGSLSQSAHVSITSFMIPPIDVSTENAEIYSLHCKVVVS